MVDVKWTSLWKSLHYALNLINDEYLLSWYLPPYITTQRRRYRKITVHSCCFFSIVLTL